MKVYVLRKYKGFMDDYEEEIVGVYSTEEKAQEKINIETWLESQTGEVYWEYEIHGYIVK